VEKREGPAGNPPVASKNSRSQKEVVCALGPCFAETPVDVNIHDLRKGAKRTPGSKTDLTQLEGGTNKGCTCPNAHATADAERGGRVMRQTAGGRRRGMAGCRRNEEEARLPKVGTWRESTGSKNPVTGSLVC